MSVEPTSSTDSATATPVRVAVVSAGLRSPSTTAMLATELGEAVTAAFAAVGRRVELQQVEVREFAHQVVDAMATGFANPGLQTALDTVTGADALIVVTPTFSASYSGMFKSFIDVIEPEALIGKPMILAATGGTDRHSLMIEHALRPLFSYLGADPVRTGVFAATADFGGSDGGLITSRAAKAASELVQRVAGTSAPAIQPSHPQPAASTRDHGASSDLLGEDQVVPFAQLLARVRG